VVNSSDRIRIEKMHEQSRRQFIQSSAVALGATGVLGAGIGQQPGGAQENGVPGYAEWIPEGEGILNQQGELEIGTYAFDTQIELFGEVSPGGQQPLQFEPFVYTASMLGLWRALTVVDLAEPVLGSLNDAETAEEADPSGVPADRHVLIGRTSVYTGSFDTDAIAEAVQNSNTEATEFDRLYEYPESGAVIAWGDGYLIQGDTRSVEQVATIRDAGDGDQPARYENSTELAELLAAVDHSGQTIVRLTGDGTLSTDQYSEAIDHSPLEGATSYIGTLGYDIETAEFDATTVVRYPDQESVDPDRLSEMVTNELSQEVTTDGQSARVTARYARSDVGFDIEDDESDDGDDQNGDDSGNDSDSGQDDQTMDDSDTNDSEDDSESSDGSGPGFGLVTGLSAVGGAGYLLSQRLGDDSE
jgi:hypothetical protein